MNYNAKIFSLPALVLGGCIIIATIVGSMTFYKSKSLENTLSVTGSAKVSVKADNVKWTITVNRVVSALSVADAYNKVSADVVTVKNFLLKNGIKEAEIETSPIFVEDYWTGENKARQSNVRQMVTVKTKDVDRVKTISQNTLALAQSGAAFSPQSPEYYVSTLPDLRISLLGQAITDSRARAAEIVKPLGQSVGKLKSASSGVVQVLQPNSIDVSDYGQYDTSTIDKEVMITVRAVFVLN